MIETIHGNVQLYGLREKMNVGQERYVDSIMSNTITFCNAPAGTGKTTVAVAIAKYLHEKEGTGLTYIFAPIQEGSLGHRPGTQEEKESEYKAPLIDALLELGELPDNAIKSESMPKDKQWVTAKSHTFMRGTNIKDQTVIIDEAQNFTRGELKKILTRCHDSCRIIVIGHDGQNDLKNPSKSGFVPYLTHFEPEEYCGVVKLTESYRGEISKKADELRWD
ncbi:PhoH family protein [Abyssicoccus albus]|uniref:PhoH family protein n=1 Tax=Abyssicoccus albus TaxID=1817405 RepID=UPI000F503024|nr:PhoH family protein [Abyssicoccus albus]